MKQFTISLIFIVSLSVLPSSLQASTIEELQIQIETLLGTVSSLQNQLNKLSENNDGLLLSRNLSIGDKGSDVKKLQQILNSDPKTIISLSGPGSPGNETDYFGNLTKQAVTKFQELYAVEILIPVNLISGTGFVGPSTRAKINSLLNTGVKAKPSTETTENEIPSSGEQASTNPTENNTSNPSNLAVTETTTPASETSPTGALIKERLSLPNSLTVALLSKNVGVSGEEIIVYGSGFDPKTKNFVNLGDNISIPANPTSDGLEIRFTIPKNITPGNYPVYVTSGGFVSNKNISFVVQKNISTSPPIVASITPLSGPRGQEITVTGTGFTKTGNNIHTSYGIIQNIPSSDGKTLTFKIAPDETSVPSFQNEDGSSANIDWPIWFYVVNENGTNDTQSKFILEI